MPTESIPTIPEASPTIRPTTFWPVYVLNYLSDGAEYWLYYRCNVELTWFSDPEPGRWDAVPDEERRVWGLFCAQRYQAPFKDL